MFTTHYRKQLNLSGEALEACRRSGSARWRFCGSARGGDRRHGRASGIAAELEQEFRDALFDDLNAPEALAALFTFIKKVNAELDRGGTNAKGLTDARAAFAELNGVLDIIPEKAEATADLSGWVEERIAARKAARASRDFALGDRIRQELLDRGIIIEDSPAGTRWKVK